MIRLALVTVLVAGCVSSSGWSVWYRDASTPWTRDPSLMTKADCEKALAVIEATRKRVGDLLPTKTICLPAGEKPPE